MKTDELLSSDDDRPQRIALVAGASGMVGTELCSQLRRDRRFAPVVVLARSRPPVTEPPLQIEIVDFSRIGEWNPSVQLDTVFCALGTTIAKAGSEAAFRAVDHDLVLEMARLAQRGQARHFIFVSSLGADPESSIFYLRVKGEAEEAVKALGLPHAVALRPSFLDGARARAAARRNGGPDPRPGAEAAPAGPAGEVPADAGGQGGRGDALRRRSAAAKASRCWTRWPSAAGRSARTCCRNPTSSVASRSQSVVRAVVRSVAADRGGG